MTQQIDTGWKYYMPEDGETAADAVSIKFFAWSNFVDAEDAAQSAAEEEWDHRDGSERGLDAKPKIVVIAPDGEETTFSVTREISIDHHVTQET